MNNTPRPRRILRRIGALLAGMLSNIVLSIGADLALNAAGIFPSLNEPEKFTTALLALATAYRSAFGVAGSYLTARLAPDHPLGHAMTLGVLGLLASIAGALTKNAGGHDWYPWALVVLALPGAWAGGKLYLVQTAARSKMAAAPRFENP